MKKQDMVLLRHSQGKGKASVVVFNKWDLVQRSKEEYIRLIEGRIREYKYIPYVFVSALYNKNIPGLINTIQQVAKAYKIRIPTSKINRIIQEAVAKYSPPSRSQRGVKIYYTTQVETAPPRFVMFTNRKSSITQTYRRYLINTIRSTFSLEGVPIFLNIRRRM